MGENAEWLACKTREAQASFKRRWAQLVFQKVEVQRTKSRAETLAANAGTEGRFVTEHTLIETIGPVNAANYIQSCREKPAGELSSWIRWNPMAKCEMFNWYEDTSATKHERKFTVATDQIEIAEGTQQLALTDAGRSVRRSESYILANHAKNKPPAETSAEV